jgi:hypothetical protein
MVVMNEETHMCTVELVKYHLKGSLEGIETVETMMFVSWDRACKWAAGVTEKVSVPYVVMKMTDLESGQVEKF